MTRPLAPPTPVRPTLANSSARSSSSRPYGVATWMHLCNGLDPMRDGGMVPSILGMTGSLARLKARRGAPDRLDDPTDASPTSPRGRVRIVTPTPSRREALTLPQGVELVGPTPEFEAEIRRADLVHMHGLWQIHTRRGAPAARAARVPYLIAAHGMAEPWALRHKRWRKWIYTALVEGPNLRNASCLHALTRPEVDHLQTLAPEAPVCLVPNGVDLEPFEDLPPRSELETECPELEGKFVLLFLSRLHVKKGLDLLADAFARIADDWPDLHLLLAGHDDGAWPPFRQAIEAAGLTERMTWVGHVNGWRARRAWAAADAFILPSYSEGFSMAILEALACRLPVIATTACHFPELAQRQAGLVVEPSREGVLRALRALQAMSPSERAELGERGRRLVEADYTWDRQAEKLARVYDWLLGGGTPPEAVVEPRGRAGRRMVATTTAAEATANTPAIPHPHLALTTGYIRASDHRITSKAPVSKAPVSVLVPVKNEAANLERCLPALAWADEVFVVDSQSQDATVEVAQRHGARVVQFYFNGVYPKKKNWALDSLPFRNEWVLIVDADEVVPPQLANEIAQRIATDEADGFLLNMKYFFLGRRIRHCGYAECWNLRLFKHRMGRYERMPVAPGSGTGDNEAHEHVILDGRIKKLTHELDHYAYPDISTWVEKHNRYAAWEAEQYERFLKEPIPKGIGAGKRFKRMLKKIYLRLPARPVIRFLYAYVARLGFLDGKPGLAFCGLLAFYDFLAWAKRYEKSLQSLDASHNEGKGGVYSES